MTEPTVTPASEWHAQRTESEQGYVVPLPSGNVVRLRPVALDVLILSGKLPDILTPIAAKSLWTETKTDDIASQVEMAKGFIDLINIIVPAALLYPRITETPQYDDDVRLDDIDFRDRVHIFQVATQPAAALYSFRREQEERMAAISNSQNNQQPTEQTSTAQAVG